MLPLVSELLPSATVNLVQSEETAEQFLPNADVILDAYMKVPFPAARLDHAPTLKLVITATTGADHIDSAALKQRNIPLMTLKDTPQVIRNITAAAEHSWLLLLACARQLPSAYQHVLDKQWDRNQFPGIMLNGKTLGIIGCGRIGGWMGRYAAAFGMTNLGYDPFLDDASFPSHIQRVELDELLNRSDFVTVHVPLSDQTEGLLGAKELELMKHGSIVINTSRGGIVDEAALLAALQSGHLRGAGLDVLKGEPDIAEHPLVIYAQTHPELIITPHIGGFSPDALKFVLTHTCQRIREYLNDHA